MQTLEKALADLVLSKQITMEHAASRTSRPEELRRLVSDLG
jgi:twitching motility protein PilT